MIAPGDERGIARDALRDPISRRGEITSASTNT